MTALPESMPRYGARVGAPDPAAIPSPAAALRLVGLGALVGIPAALVAAAFVALVHQLEVWLWHDLPERLDATSPPWYLVLGIPLAGAIVVVAARTLLPGDGGHQPLEGIGGGATPVRYAPGIALAAIGSLAFGAVLGPEAPLIALGSATALAIAAGARLATASAPSSRPPGPSRRSRRSSVGRSSRPCCSSSRASGWARH